MSPQPQFERSSRDPFAAPMRKRRRGISRGVLTVYSDEPGRPPRPPEPVQGHGRPRAVNGTISYLPPLFGLMLAGAIVKAILEHG